MSLVLEIDNCCLDVAGCRYLITGFSALYYNVENLSSLCWFEVELLTDLKLRVNFYGIKSTHCSYKTTGKHPCVSLFLFFKFFVVSVFKRRRKIDGNVGK